MFCVLCSFFCSPHTVAQLHTHSECTRAVVQLSSVSACTSFCSHPLMKWIAPNIYHSVDTLPHIRHSFMYYVNTAVGWLAGSCCLCNSLLTGISFVSEVRKFITEFFFSCFWVLGNVWSLVVVDWVSIPAFPLTVSLFMRTSHTNRRDTHTASCVPKPIFACGCIREPSDATVDFRPYIHTVERRLSIYTSFFFSSLT